MINIFVGLIFVFFKTNLSFFEFGATYYITNIIGYISILFGINELGRINQKTLKVRPYVIIMIAHSTIFFLLNSTGNSLNTIGFSTTLEVIIALVGVVFITTAGMFMVFVIITELMDDLISKKDKERLYNLVNIMMLLFILAGISAYFNLLAATIMGILLLLEVLFLIRYYYVFILKNEIYT